METTTVHLHGQDQPPAFQYAMSPSITMKGRVPQQRTRERSVARLTLIGLALLAKLAGLMTRKGMLLSGIRRV